MTSFAMIAILLSASLAQADAGGSHCKSALTRLAAAAHTAAVATDSADREVAKVDQLDAKLEGCRKSRGTKASGCAKLEQQLKEAEITLDLAEEELTLALEAVDDSYDEFDVACSWDDPDANVQVRLATPDRHDPDGAKRTATPDSHAASARGR